MRALRKKRVDMIENLRFHQDNAPPHTASMTTDTLKDLGFQLVKHAAYSPDLAPADFAVFRHLKEEVAGEKFTTREELVTRVNDVLQEMSRSGRFQGIFQQWVKRHERCEEKKGAYFEKE